MTLLWPGFLPLLLFMPLLGGLYLWQLRRQRFALRYPSLALVRAARPPRSVWRRHLPPAFFLLALTSLLFALGRPVAIVPVPTDRATIMLALDTSGSMSTADIRPSRLAAAEKAALSFIQQQKPHTQIGLVAFAHTAEVIQPPTSDQEALQNALDSLLIGNDGTAIGRGILKSLDAIAAIDQSVAPTVVDPTTALMPSPVPKGAYAADIIVLLTDGENTAGPSPVEAAQQAVDRGVRIYTIGYGTASTISSSSNAVDEDPLRQIAKMTGGVYYSAKNSSQLHQVFTALPTHLITKHETREISVLFAACGALLATLAIGFALHWRPFP